MITKLMKENPKLDDGTEQMLQDQKQAIVSQLKDPRGKKARAAQRKPQTDNPLEEIKEAAKAAAVDPMEYDSDLAEKLNDLMALVSDEVGMEPDR